MSPEREINVQLAALFNEWFAHHECDVETITMEGQEEVNCVWIPYTDERKAKLEQLFPHPDVIEAYLELGDIDFLGLAIDAELVDCFINDEFLAFEAEIAVEMELDLNGKSMVSFGFATVNDRTFLKVECAEDVMTFEMDNHMKELFLPYFV